MTFDKEDREFLHNKVWKIGRDRLLIEMSNGSSIVDGNTFEHHEIFQALRDNPELRVINGSIHTYLFNKYPEYFV